MYPNGVFQLNGNLQCAKWTKIFHPHRRWITQTYGFRILTSLDSAENMDRPFCHKWSNFQEWQVMEVENSQLLTLWPILGKLIYTIVQSSYSTRNTWCMSPLLSCDITINSFRKKSRSKFASDPTQRFTTHFSSWKYVRRPLGCVVAVKSKTLRWVFYFRNLRLAMNFSQFSINFKMSSIRYIWSKTTNVHSDCVTYP